MISLEIKRYADNDLVIVGLRLVFGHGYFATVESFKTIFGPEPSTKTVNICRGSEPRKTTDFVSVVQRRDLRGKMAGCGIRVASCGLFDCGFLILDFGLIRWNKIAIGLQVAGQWNDE